MGSIRLLDEETINAIAAGEVADRPASVVKELVENAIDAGADAVSIEITGGGIDLIRVTDNGGGIPKEEIPDAFVRHATSKIACAADLLQIGTLGFRGEALSSIAAVSQTELLTKTRQEIAGIRYCIEGGQERSMDETACPDGTTILVRNLFYNTPARRKFLKSSVTEAGYVGDLISRLALSRPDVRFKYSSGGQLRLSTSGNGNLKEVIYQVFGRDVALHLLEAHRQTELLQIGGFIGKPILSRGNRSWENYFINGRYIKSDVITRAIEDAYRTFVMIHKFPFTALTISMEPELMDVNVHPRKMDVRFHQNEEVYNLVFETVRSLLKTRELTVQGSLSEEKPSHSQIRRPAPADIPEPFEKTGQNHIRKEKQAAKIEEEPAQTLPAKIGEEPSQTPPDSPADCPDIRYPSAEPVPGQGETNQDRTDLSAKGDQLYLSGVRQESLIPENLMDQKAGPYTRLAGQVFGTYWILEFNGKMYMMDQHAAHEKVLYERIRNQMQEGTLPMQYLTPAVIVTLSSREQALLTQYMEYFRKLAFEIEPFGGDEFAIYGVPSFLFGMNIRDLFIELMDSLSLERSNAEGSQITWKIASLACKAAVKGNTVLSQEEALSLLDQLRQCQDPYNCPHGRPTIVSFTRYELDKRFKRIQD